jgi:hypothetical protein
VAWDHPSKERSYYTRSRRVNGRVVREYHGRGPLGELAAAMDDLERHDRAAQDDAWKIEKERLEAAETPLDKLCQQTDFLARATLYAEGFHRCGGQWRLRNMSKYHDEPEGEIPPGYELQWLLGRAERGDRNALPRLKRLLKEHQDVWVEVEAMALQIEQTWLVTVAGSNPVLTQSINQALKAMRAQLSGPAPSQLERILIERACLTRLQESYIDFIDAQNKDQIRSPAQETDRQRRHNRAHHRHLAAVRKLELVRKLLGRSQKRKTDKTGQNRTPERAGSSTPY